MVKTRTMIHALTDSNHTIRCMVCDKLLRFGKELVALHILNDFIVCDKCGEKYNRDKEG